MQKILKGHKNIKIALEEVGSRNFLLVCDSSFSFLPIKDVFHPKTIFDQFTPNPLYEQVCKGVELFNSNQCDAIVAIGGGSTIDVAKCIKLYCKMDPAQNFLQQEAKDSGVPLIAIPTTAGTGSESTRYAVIYFEGKKQSVTHESIIPNYAILEPMLLKTLPLYQKKCTMMDALCQGIESWWSVNSTDESKMYSKIAVQMIMQYWEDYIFHNTDEAAEGIMSAANYAGRAINITQTTAPHAMSYKLTSMYGLPHGHAVALCLPVVWQYMNNHPEQCVDPRGKDYLLTTFDDIARALACHDANEAANYIINLLKILELQNPETKDRVMELEVLTNSVNPTRLKNNPIHLDSNACFSLYELII